MKSFGSDIARLQDIHSNTGEPEKLEAAHWEGLWVARPRCLSDGANLARPARLSSDPHHRPGEINRRTLLPNWNENPEFAKSNWKGSPLETHGIDLFGRRMQWEARISPKRCRHGTAEGCCPTSGRRPFRPVSQRSSGMPSAPCRCRSSFQGKWDWARQSRRAGYSSSGSPARRHRFSSGSTTRCPCQLSGPCPASSISARSAASSASPRWPARTWSPAS